MSDTKKNPTVEKEAVPATKPDKPRFVFADYVDNTEGYDPTDINQFLKDGADVSGYQFAWLRYDDHGKAQSRYYVQVKQDTHGDLFRADAFDAINGCIGRGYGKKEMGGVPEISLFCRPAEADIAEQEQMSRASQRRLDPEHNKGLNDIKERIGNVIGSQHVSGKTSTNRSGWGSN